MLAVNDPGNSRELTLLNWLSVKIQRMVLKSTSRLSQIRELGMWFEKDLADLARDQGLGTVRLRRTQITANPGYRLETRVLRAGIDGLPDVHRLLEACGIQRLALDSRLEANQIEDVLVLLSTLRKRLGRKHGRRGLASAMYHPGGVHIACTHTWIADQTLHIAYTYCATRMSELVRWFEERGSHFRDHRALFNVAPRIALVSSLIGVIPFLLYNLHSSWWVLLLATFLEGCILFALVYLFFLTAGSLEYDNEEKAYHLENALINVRRYAENIQEDLRRARAVQQMILPDGEHMPLADQLEWASSFTPQDQVGGDYFDVAPLGPNRMALLFADVSGHGMAAALLTSVLKTAFTSWVDEDDDQDLRGFVDRLNRLLVRVIPDDSFAAVFVCVYDAAHRTMEHINCGHSPQPMWVPADRDEPVRPASTASTMILGVLEDIHIRPATVQLAPGDTILMLTDGFVEAVNEDGEMYGLGRYEQLLSKHRPASAAAAVQLACAEVERFTGDASQTDDRAALAFRVR